MKEIFDELADRFDEHLVENLEYRTPSSMRKALESIEGKSFRFENALDLGCGAGLSGAGFRDVCGRLTGVDISGRMIEMARKKNIYDELLSGDFFELFEGSERKFDLILAVDVFVYKGDLRPAAELAGKICEDGGFFAFSAERHEGPGFALRDTGRYAHSVEYVKKTVEERGFSMEFHGAANLRKEKGRWVDGDIYIFKKNRVPAG